MAQLVKFDFPALLRQLADDCEARRIDVCVESVRDVACGRLDYTIRTRHLHRLSEEVPDAPAQSETA